MIIWMERPLANDHPDGLASCKWSSGWNGLLQMIFGIDWPLANDHLDGTASCKWSSGWTGLLKMIIWMDTPLANDHPDGLASCKWSSGWTSLLQMIIQMDWPLTNDQNPNKRFPLFTCSSFGIFWLEMSQIVKFHQFWEKNTNRWVNLISLCKLCKRMFCWRTLHCWQKIYRRYLQISPLLGVSCEQMLQKEFPVMFQ